MTDPEVYTTYMSSSDQTRILMRFNDPNLDERVTFKEVEEIDGAAVRVLRELLETGEPAVRSQAARALLAHNERRRARVRERAKDGDPSGASSKPTAVPAGSVPSLPEIPQDT